MADVKAFKGYRFKLGIPDDLGRHCTPPYDMIDDAMVDRFYDLHEHNVVRIIQNRREDADAANKDRHVRAAAFLKEWVDKGVIVQDAADSVYIYRQQFTVERGGKPVTYERTGICVLLKLVDFEEQIVLPHEYTLSGPKQDRYELMETTNATTEQIFGLAADGDGALYSLISEVAASSLLKGTFTDGDGTVHSLYQCTNAAQIAKTVELMKTRSILIADGHHRYETALRFWRERQPKWFNPFTWFKDAGAFSHVMMTLVSMADPGLVIRPFHRLVRKTGEGRTAESMINELAKYFDMEVLGSASAAGVDNALSADAGSGAAEVVYWDRASGELFGLRLNAGGEEFLAGAMPEQSAAWKRLDVSKINCIIINGILDLPLNGHVLHDIVHYVNDTSAGAKKLLEDGNDYYGGFFIRPVSINVINDTVKGGERMPQKSTNFFPKLYSGLVFNRM
ncbi:MAG: DUF1015 domain-containing protein [Chitinispirillia bacterium]|nr:DUF1015 domain-containing protein [Chitinispirillia bacterium]MCL2241584.1 DUF1015 domain-containing protein [Chitinispirillia bacterium]